jgi:DNA-binding CsgD family transcriptional regulator
VERLQLETVCKWKRAASTSRGKLAFAPEIQLGLGVRRRKFTVLQRPKSRKVSSPLLSREEVPRDLRSHVFELDGRQYAVVSFESAQAPRLAGLSKAETEVVRAALAGLTNEEIAVTRGRSIFTIQNQLAAAWRKLGVSSRHEAAALLGTLPEG